MTLAHPEPAVKPAKAPIGNIGFDKITGSGWPRGHTTLLAGRSGADKYRGLSFDEDKSPFSIEKRGLELRTRMREGSAP